MHTTVDHRLDADIDHRGTDVLGHEVVTRSLPRLLLAIARIAIGFYFLWAFIDKVIGLRYTTMPQGRWEVFGGTGQPTQDFLRRAEGPVAGFLNNAFGNSLGDWLFMISLLLIGVAFITGAGLKLAGIGGAILMALMYLVALPEPSAMVNGELVRGSSNPIVDSHWIDALVLLICAFTRSGDTLGLGRWWARVVGRKTWLR